MEGMVLTVDEVAKLLKVSRQTLYNLLKDKQFPPGFRVGRQRRWNMDHIREFMNAQANPAK